MKLITKIQKWGDTHHPLWIDFIRITLGLVLMYKGIQFALNLDAFSQVMARTVLAKSLGISLVAHLIIYVHIIGGLFIAIGTHTRVCCLLQIPILLVAVFYVNLPNHIFEPYAEFRLSVAVLFALIFFMVEGDGPLSVERDKYLNVIEP